MQTSTATPATARPVTRRVTRRVTPHAMRPGMRVHYYGGVFEVLAAPVEAGCFRPGTPSERFPGPSACVTVAAVCVSGSVPGYFKPGTSWTFQGNFLAGFNIEETPAA